jgi:predicted N-formylglutamate amidohydrolase
MNGLERIWDIGVLWNRDPRLPQPLIKHLRHWENLNIGDNEPYSGRDLAYTIDTHGLAGGLANAAVEIRQDHCATPENASHWADILADAMRPILDQPDLRQVKHY